jgi:hypothetical protein
MENRIFYNPENGTLHIFDFSHVIFYHANKEKLGKFDDCIRGIINDNILYLRVFYPFDNIDELSYSELIEKSGKLLALYQDEIVKELKSQGHNIGKIVLNITNIELRKILNTQYV